MNVAATDNVPGPVGTSEAPEPNEPALEIEIEEEDEPSDEPDDLEELELEGRKAKIPKPWKDLVEQGKDYRYKTGKVAEEKRAVEAEKARYAGMIQQVEQALKANQPDLPDEAMLDRMSDKYDPDAYHMQVAKYNKWSRQMGQAQQERKRLEAEEQTKAERERSERKTTTEKELLKAIPKWRDNAVRASDRAKLETYLSKQLGVTAEEFGELDHDHRLTVGMYKAMLYDEAVSKAKANKTTTEIQAPTQAAPVRRVGGGHGNNGGIPKTTEGYIAWRRKGGKM